MKLEIHDVKDYGSKLVFKMEYDEDFRLAVAKALKKENPSKKDIQAYILKSLEKTVFLSLKRVSAKREIPLISNPARFDAKTWDCASSISLNQTPVRILVFSNWLIPRRA